MHWITADLIMFVSSVILYLTIRKAGLAGFPTQVNNLAMFGIPAIVYSIYSLGHSADFAAFTPWLWGVTLTTGVLAYVSNAASLRSIEIAPNPGYSLMISKSAVILTILLAVPIFGSELTGRAILAVLLILAFSRLIITSPGQKHKAKHTQNAWLQLSLVAFVGWAFLALSAKYVFIHGVSAIAFVNVFFVVVTCCILCEIWHKRPSFTSVRKRPWLFLQIGVCSTIWNFFLFYAIQIAPNPGYINATNTASIAVVTLMAAWLFKDDLTWRKAIGVFGVMVGLLLLFLE